MPFSNNVIEKEDAELGYPILLVKNDRKSKFMVPQARGLHNSMLK